MKKFRINTIIVGFIFLTVFTCGETPAEVLSSVNFSVEQIEVVNNKRDLKIKSEKSVFLPIKQLFKDYKENYGFSDVYTQFSFCSFAIKSLPPRASPLS
ncbi:hypothetical protein [Desulfurobacterium indicum]|uniref:Uncharacterized protein n=1 Tax=Desulfurobacterium indicum TaxID=1914305 RepID=A0A1R1MNA0_9BACT|nr:hypothetical protein [Desulfurobacterium indicum]OMH41256.1 hypothetical protein BLW93_00885 [Desulfurobacterium indicum]